MHLIRCELNKIEINEIFNAGLQYLEQSLTLEKLMFFFINKNIVVKILGTYLKILLCQIHSKP